VVTLAFIIARIPIQWKKIVFTGIILALSALVIRSLPIPFGVHTIFLIILLFVSLYGLGKGDISLSLIASLVSYLALVIFEISCLSLLMPIFNLTPETLFRNSWLRVFATLPQVILLFILAYIVNRVYPIAKRHKGLGL